MNGPFLNDAQWDEIYCRTFFQVKNPRGELVSFTAKTAEKHSFLKEKIFSIITAFNPMHANTPLPVNCAQNQLLKNDLEKLGYLFYATRGELDGHAEESFTIEGIREEEAVALGRKYRQRAVLYHDKKGVRFLRCFSD